MFDIGDLIDFVANLFGPSDGVGLRRTDRVMAAYKNAWSVRRRRGLGADDVLFASLREAGVEEFGGQGLVPPDVEQAIREWRAGSSPRTARKRIRQVRRQGATNE